MILIEDLRLASDTKKLETRSTKSMIPGFRIHREPFTRREDRYLRYVWRFGATRPFVMVRRRVKGQVFIDHFKNDTEAFNKSVRLLKSIHDMTIGERLIASKHVGKGKLFDLILTKDILERYKFFFREFQQQLSMDAILSIKFVGVEDWDKTKASQCTDFKANDEEMWFIGISGGIPLFTNVLRWNMRRDNFILAFKRTYSKNGVHAKDDIYVFYDASIDDKEMHAISKAIFTDKIHYK